LRERASIPRLSDLTWICFAISSCELKAIGFDQLKLTMSAATKWWLFSTIALLALCSVTEVHSLCTPMPSILKLRGGGWFPRIGSNNEASTEPARAESKSSSDQNTPAQQQQQETQQSVVGHAFEYALAGSMDGIRSGVGQGIGAKCYESPS
jgi:hypothetical protein